MIEKLALPEIRELIEVNDLTTLGDVLNDWFPADLAALAQHLDEPEQLKFFRALKAPVAATTFEYLDLDTQRRLLEEFTQEEAGAILERMAADDRTALLEELPADRANQFLALLSPERRTVALSLLQYPEESIGRVMTPDYVAVKKNWTIKHVLDHVRSQGKDRETLNVLYVVDDNHKLIDDIRIREVLLTPLHVHVSDVMDGRFVALRATDDKETAVGVFRKYDRTALPVIDDRGMLVGIVTIDDVLDIAEEAATRELQHFGGLEALDEPYVATPVLSMVRKRASWLVILFVSEMLTATAMGHYEDKIAKAVHLAIFVPLIISSGGNTGSQAATLIIRALALGELKLGDWWKVLRRELASGLLLGLILGTIGLVRITIWGTFLHAYQPDWKALAATVSIALVGIVMWGTISGSMLPFVLKRLGVDPATSSAPFVATLMDVTGLIIYFNVAEMIMSV